MSEKKNRIEKFELSQDSRFLGFFNEKNNGLIGIVSPKSRQLLFDLKMNENCTDLKFLGENQLVSSGNKGYLYLWDLRMRRIVNRVKDKGSVKISALATNEDSLVVGSTAGVINVYKLSSILNGNANKEIEPLFSYNNLTTAITNLEIDDKGERIAGSSKWVKGALKMINNNENCVFKNWPNFRTKMSLISQMKMSQDGSRIFVGEDTGIVKVYKFSN